jgi:hypothetical protein
LCLQPGKPKRVDFGCVPSASSPSCEKPGGLEGPPGDASI